MEVVCFPELFSMRPCDRAFDYTLRGMYENHTQLSCVGIRHMIWFEFAAARTGTRPYGKDHRESTAHLIASYCNWEDKPMELIKIGVAVNFFEINEDKLILRDFEKMNPHLLPGYTTMQQRGALAKAAGAVRKKSAKDAGDLFKLAEARKGGVFADLEIEDEKTRKSALVLVCSVARILGMDTPNERTVSAPIIALAAQMVMKYDEEYINGKLIDLLQEVKSAGTQKRNLSQVFEGWASRRDNVQNITT